MNGKPVTKTEIKKIKKLRETGHSLPEICRSLQRGSSIVHKFAKDVTVFPKYISVLRQKQGGSFNRSKKLWKTAENEAVTLLKKIDKRDKLLVLASLYWGEGTKNELNIINSDPKLIQVFISCLKEIGIKENDLRISLRLYNDININEAKKYWAKICKINIKNILSVNILRGKKTGKLPYGMCRIRVTKGGKSFKLIMSMIEFIKSQIITLS
jgi:hypothetical protein